jgi:catechol 2,3-dioxygenase-like lactoylglutathione lyase family enzyme
MAIPQDLPRLFYRTIIYRSITKESTVQLQRLDHFTLRTARLEATLRFYERMTGMRAGARPPFAFPGHWLYLDGRPVLHLAGPAHDAGLEDYLGDRGTGDTTGAVDHIAFRATGLPGFEDRLVLERCPYRGRTVPQLGEHQVFLQDPNGVTVEFIFPSSEPASWHARPARP